MATIIDLSAKQSIARSLKSSGCLLHQRIESIAPSHDTGPTTSWSEVLGELAQRALGTLFVLFGAALTLTLWLLPIGLPLGLLGCALLATPRAKA
ncbi:MAG TPA: hypothetical protein VG055_08540 [Planctomycetaceae bacterium]|jgi:hypothetical protein|nr:hypothetical protein [Planctomycetaceae bacterium]